MRQVVFDGLAGYELTDEKARLVILTECGPRIAFFGPKDGENLLYWDEDGVIRGEYRLRGGHRVWLTRPMADESEDTYRDDNEPCRVDLLPDGLTVTQPAHPSSLVERGIKVRSLGEGRFEVTNFVKNVGGLI